MKTFFTFIAGMALGFVLGAGYAHASTALPPPPPNGWCYDSFTTPNYNGVRSCPNAPPPAAGRIINSNIAYVPATGSLRFTGVTEWSAIWGHATPFDAEVPFPGRMNSQPTILNFTRTGYIAVGFTPSASPRFGYITHTEYSYGADLTWSISTQAGDFAPVNPKCHGATLSGQPVGKWTTAPATYGSFCPVSPGVRYYLNIKLTDPAQVTRFCAANQVQCAIGTANSFGQ